MPRVGDEIRGELDSADASGGVAFTLYDAGSLTARVLAADENISIDSLWVHGVNAIGAFEVFAGADGTPGAGETILKAPAPVGTANQGPHDVQFGDTPWCGAKGHNVYLNAGVAGQVDAVFTGRISK